MVTKQYIAEHEFYKISFSCVRMDYVDSICNLGVFRDSVLQRAFEKNRGYPKEIFRFTLCTLEWSRDIELPPYCQRCRLIFLKNCHFENFKLKKNVFAAILDSTAIWNFYAWQHFF
jgi:hypothetical protein